MLLVFVILIIFVLMLASRRRRRGFTAFLPPIDDTFVYNYNTDSVKKYDMETYVIALPERLEYIKQTLADLGIKPHIYNAFLKSRIPEERGKLVDAGYITEDSALKPGEIACHVSHIQVLRDFLANGKEYALIFEDDMMSPNNQEDLEDIFARVFAELEELRTKWEYLNMGRCWADCTKERAFGKLIYKTPNALCRHSYIVSRSGAKKLIEGTLPMHNEASDIMVAKMIDSNNLNGFSTKPALFSQNRTKFGTNLGNWGPLWECKPPLFKEIGTILKGRL